MAAVERRRVVVVGGGPAGAAAALTLARGGVDVLVLDAARFPRDKACGDALGLDCYRELEILGLLPRVRAVARATFHGMGLAGPSGQRVELTLRDGRLPGFADHTFCIPRVVLDHTLIQAAADAGAEVREEVRVTAVIRDAVEGVDRIAGVRCADGAVIGAEVVVGCGGEHDPVSRAVGRPGAADRKAFAVRAYFDGLPEPVPLAEFSFAEFVQPGYGWVFPTSPTGANVGVGLRLDALKSAGHDLRGLLDRFVDRDPVARRWLRGARRTSAVKGWPLTFGSQAGRTTGPGWMLCGDAACLIDPVSGEGIGNALLSGRLAAETLLAGDWSPAGLAQYERRWRRELAWSFRVGQWVQAAMTRPWVVNRIVRQSQRRRGFGNMVIGVVGGAYPKTRVLTPRSIAGLLV